MQWLLFRPYGLKRLNLIETDVNNSVLSSDKLTTLGEYKIDVIQYILSNDDYSMFKWYLKNINLQLRDNCTLYKFLNKQHLKNYHNRYHNEIWIFAKFIDVNNREYLCPINRDSDYYNNIFDELQKIRTSQ